MAKEEQIKSQIILEGEKEYRSACKGINTSLREIGSEMKLATAEFGDNAESIDALTRKQDILKKSLEEQAKKAKAAEDALKKMRDGGIEPTNPAYQKMQTALNNTKADMVKIQKEIDDTSEKLKKSKIDWESVGDTVGGGAFGGRCKENVYGVVRHSWRRRTGDRSRRPPCKTDEKRKRACNVDGYSNGRICDLRRQLAY